MPNRRSETVGASSGDADGGGADGSGGVPVGTTSPCTVSAPGDRHTSLERHTSAEAEAEGSPAAAHTHARAAGDGAASNPLRPAPESAQLKGSCEATESNMDETESDVLCSFPRWRVGPWMEAAWKVGGRRGLAAGAGPGRLHCPAARNRGDTACVETRGSPRWANLQFIRLSDVRDDVSIAAAAGLRRAAVVGGI